jgi:hypothetical protein
VIAEEADPEDADAAEEAPEGAEEAEETVLKPEFCVENWLGYPLWQ